MKIRCSIAYFHSVYQNIAVFVKFMLNELQKKPKTSSLIKKKLKVKLFANKDEKKKNEERKTSSTISKHTNSFHIFV